MFQKVPLVSSLLTFESYTIEHALVVVKKIHIQFFFLRMKKNCYFSRPLALFTAISKIMVLDKMQPAFKKKSYRDTTLHINTIVF